MSLLTARQVMDELVRLGVGTWDPSQLRKWIVEEPACPIAEHADRGKPHRFRLLEVLNWLLERERRAKARGYTTGGGPQLADRLELALRHFVNGTEPAVQAPPAPLPSDLVDGLELPPAKANGAPLPLPQQQGTDWEHLTDLEAVLAVLRGQQPQNWKAVEEALNQRRRRLQAEGLLVPVEEVEQILSAQALAVRGALQAMVMGLAQRIPDHSTFEQRRGLLQTAVDDVLTRLSRDDHEDGAQLAEAA